MKFLVLSFLVGCATSAMAETQKIDWVDWEWSAAKEAAVLTVLEAYNENEDKK